MVPGAFCNKTVFEEAGAKLPETYTELLEAVQKIKAIGKIPIASGHGTAGTPPHLPGIGHARGRRGKC